MLSRRLISTRSGCKAQPELTGFDKGCQRSCRPTQQVSNAAAKSYLYEDSGAGRLAGGGGLDKECAVGSASGIAESMLAALAAAAAVAEAAAAAAALAFRSLTGVVGPGYASMDVIQEPSLS